MQSGVWPTCNHVSADRPEFSHAVRQVIQDLHDDGFGVPRKNSASRASVLRYSAVALKALDMSEIPVPDLAANQDDDADLTNLGPI